MNLDDEEENNLKVRIGKNKINFLVGGGLSLYTKAELNDTLKGPNPYRVKIGFCVVCAELNIIIKENEMII